MKRLNMVAIVLSLVLSSCNGQTKTEANSDEKDSILPEENIKVNKEFDKDGNLVRYDSTYTSFYSNIKNDTIKADSIFNSFRSFFNQTYPFSNQLFFNDLFFRDSLLRYDFYKKDFFSKRFEKNMSKMNKLFHDMDSLKNDYYDKQDEENLANKEGK